jgi:hypothetical protein
VQGLNGAHPLISDTLSVVAPEGAARIARQLHLQPAAAATHNIRVLLLLFLSSMLLLLLLLLLLFLLLQHQILEV